MLGKENKRTKNRGYEVKVRQNIFTGKFELDNCDHGRLLVRSTLLVFGFAFMIIIQPVQILVLFAQTT